MPIVYDTDMMNALYRRGNDGTGRRYGYCRAAFIQDDRSREHDLHAAPMLPYIRGDTILVIGCGLGLLNESLARSLPSATIYGIDNGPYIQELPPGELTTMPFLPLDLFDNNDDAMRAAGWPTRFDTVITEDVAAEFYGDDITKFARAVERYAAPGGTVIHFTIAGEQQKPHIIFNFMPISDWKAFAPTHTWIAADGTVV